ncbi:hypothetical protein D9Q98_004215 [Chlorella vulgaris]|uniref:Uncharacterized protein n=1 Tax=Chlorella vulgaris TaxID=3077 RepID=A0A9D4YYC7_CHLVU|nr:hypothetical protein D9Q98_004215 [Chlorella vulgaris]
MDTASFGASLVRQPSSAANSLQMVRRSGTADRNELQLLRDEAALLTMTPRASGRLLAAQQQKRAARKRHRGRLTGLVSAALLVAFLTGTTSYRMHLAMRSEQQLDADTADLAHDTWAGQGASDSGALAGLRSWLAGGRGRRNLREGLAASGAGTDRGRAAALQGSDRDAGALGVQLYNHWWMLGGDGMLMQPQAEGEQGLGGDGPMQRLLRQRRLQPSAAVRVYDFDAKSWVPHNLTRFPQEVPIARWAVTSLLNKAKKKESAIFLAGGYMSPAEAAAGRPSRPHRAATALGAASASATAKAAAAAADCPLASSAVYSLNPGRNKVRALPPLPVACYGSTAMVAGARLHVFGGWQTPDKLSRLAVPSNGHWSIGLNADGTSAPEWQQEAQLPLALQGRQLTALALSVEADGEPGIYVWAAGGSGSGANSSSGASRITASEAACHAAAAPGTFGGGSQQQQPTQLWFHSSSAGWQPRGLMPQPLSEDIQCAVAATAHQLLAVGAVERSGLFSWQRGVWEYDARAGGTWMRAGWAPVEFQGQLCAIHRGRLFVSKALPPEPLREQLPEEEEGEEEEGEEEEEAATAVSQGSELQQESLPVTVA